MPRYGWVTLVETCRLLLAVSSHCMGLSRSDRMIEDLRLWYTDVTTVTFCK